MMGGLLVVAGRLYATAYQLDVPAGWDQPTPEEAARPAWEGPLISGVHPLVKPLREGSQEELIQRASLCFLQAAKVRGGRGKPRPVNVDDPV